MGPTVSDEPIAEGGFPQVHHFRVKDDGLLTSLAVGGMYAGVIAISCAGAACVNVVTKKVASRGGSLQIERHEEGHPVPGFSVGVSVQIYGVIHIAGDGHFGR